MTTIENVEERIQFLMSESVVQYNAGDHDHAISLLVEAWDNLPGDKYHHNECYVIISRILTIALNNKNVPLLNKWIDKLLLASPDRIDSGEREMWVGRVAYESGDYEKALEYFSIANKKSGGRCFWPKDTTYRSFFIEHIKKKS